MALADPTRLEVIKNALETICDGMASTLARTARSSQVRVALDFSTGVLTPNCELVGQSFSSPVHLGGMIPALGACLERYRGRIYPGDVFANNDPYEGASHLPDVYLFKPVFAGERIVAYLGVTAHLPDIGGRVAGGNACDSTEIYQEGLRIPPLKLLERGQPNETLYRIIEKAVRVPEKVLGDIEGELACLRYGEREYIRMIERYGTEELDKYLDELLRYTEDLVRRSILACPDGTWTGVDTVDGDGFDDRPINIVATVTKKGDRVAVDFSGTSPQCKGAIQPVLATTRSMVYFVLRTVLGGDIPNTSGFYRLVDISAPEGSFVNPLPPAPVAARALGQRRITHALYRAFSQMLPSRVFACPGGAEVGLTVSGYDKSRTPWRNWVYFDAHLETACGGRTTKDGIDGQNSNVTNSANVPVETLEAEQPIRVEEYSLVADTEGAGKYRGGLGMRRKFRFLLDDSLVQLRADRGKTPPYGLHGGQPSITTHVTLVKNGQARTMPTKFLETANSGDTLTLEWPGAGGWGDPLERDPAQVLADVIEEKVSVQRAREVYGVVIGKDGRSADPAGTDALRREMRLRDEKPVVTAPQGSVASARSAP